MFRAWCSFLLNRSLYNILQDYLSNEVFLLRKTSVLGLFYYRNVLIRKAKKMKELILKNGCSCCSRHFLRSGKILFLMLSMILNKRKKMLFSICLGCWLAVGFPPWFGHTQIRTLRSCIQGIHPTAKPLLSRCAAEGFSETWKMARAPKELTIYLKG